MNEEDTMAYNEVSDVVEGAGNPNFHPVIPVNAIKAGDKGVVIIVPVKDEEGGFSVSGEVTKTEVCAFKATASSKNIRIISSDSLMSSPGNYVVNVDVEMISSLASMEFQTVASSAKSDHAIQVLDGSPEPSPSVKVDEAEAVCVAGVNAIDPRK
ncbi:hypothetical protein U1Q18_009952 [Sarracenia purpurea var. burkii]